MIFIMFSRVLFCVYILDKSVMNSFNVVWISLFSTYLSTCYFFDKKWLSMQEKTFYKMYFML